MLNYLGALTFFILLQSDLQAQTLPIKDNGEAALHLSQSNYNRLVVRQDKIVEAVFPPHTMAIRRDEQDGSVYVLLAATNPFTLFLTTETGHHFSLTLQGEEALGKTIELLPQVLTVSKASPASSLSLSSNDIMDLLNHMEQHKPLAAIKIKRQVGQAIRWLQGLSLLPRETWEGETLKGEIIALYNGGHQSLSLADKWFMQPGVKAIHLSKSILAPHEQAMLYRVWGKNHG